MRGRTTTKPHRAAIVARITVEGATEERSFAAKGVSHDGPAIGEWRWPPDAGERDVTIEIVTGGAMPVQRWTSRIPAEPRRLSVVTFEPAQGFRLEWAPAGDARNGPALEAL